MIDFSNKGLNTKLMTILSGLNNSTVSRALSANNITPIDSATKRNTRYRISDCRKVMKSLVADRNPIDPKNSVQAFYNFKGGVGKTTLCYQVATHLAICGYKVLAVDTDQQGNLSVLFGFLENMKFPTLFDGIVKNIAPEELVVNVFDGMDLIPGNISLVQLEKKISDKTLREYVFQKYLSPLFENYDFVLFDCNPSISLINRNILSVSSRLNIVAETQPNCLAAMPIVIRDTVDFFEAIDKDMLEITVIPSKYEDRSATSAEAIAFLSSQYKEWIIPDFAVRKSEDFLKSSRDQLPLGLFCKVNSIAYEDIVDLVKYIILVSKKDILKKEDKK